MVKKMSFNQKYIAKIFILKKFLVSEYIFKLVCFFVFVRVAGNQGYTSRKVFSLKNISTDWYWYGLSSRIFNNNA